MANLFSEDDVKQYFIKNNGIVRNNDIVTYFRTFLSNPNIRDEARVIFKTYVNKLATVKVENGEKFLVLKRQYYPSSSSLQGGISDGFLSNSNPMMPSTSSNYHSMSSLPNPYQYYNQNQMPSNPVNSQQQQINYGYSQQQQQQFDQSGLPTPYYSQQQQQHQLQYGSQFSLNSISNSSFMGDQPTYYSSQPQQQPVQPPTYNKPPPPNYANPNINISTYQSTSNINNNINATNPNIPIQNQITTGAAANYSDYGLPAVQQNTIQPPPRLKFNPPPAPFQLGAINVNLNSSTSNLNNVVNLPSGRLPPPYRAPPPPSFLGSPTGPPPTILNNMGKNRNSASSLRGASYTSSSSSNSGNEPPSPPASIYYQQQQFKQNPHQIQRSLSVSGLSGATSGAASAAAITTPTTSESSFNINKYFEGWGSNSNSAGTSTSASTSHLFAASTTGVGSPPQIPPRTKRSVSVISTMEETDSNKENKAKEAEKGEINNINDVNGNENEVSGAGSTEEQKISVKERMQKFNRIASESEVHGQKVLSSTSAARNRRELGNKHDSGEYDTASLSSFGFSHVPFDPSAKAWILKAAKADYHALNKMAQENPSLVKRKDMNTALHWAAKHGNVELIKLLAGTYRADVNSKSNGGYTPIHLAAQFGRQEAYDLLIQTYGGDSSLRDHSGKKPMQYFIRQDTEVSMDTFKKLKDKRHNNEHHREREQSNRESFLRIGSLNVRVKKTTEAFGHFLGKSNSATQIEKMMHKNWGSADNVQESENTDSSINKDKQLMPPPPKPTVVHRRSFASSKKKKNRRSLQNTQVVESPNNSPSIKESRSDSGGDSDTDYGFGKQWQSP